MWWPKKGAETSSALMRASLKFTKGLLSDPSLSELSAPLLMKVSLFET